MQKVEGAVSNTVSRDDSECHVTDTDLSSGSASWLNSKLLMSVLLKHFHNAVYMEGTVAADKLTVITGVMAFSVPK
jgi:hypothetical protein